MMRGRFTIKLACHCYCGETESETPQPIFYLENMSDFLRAFRSQGQGPYLNDLVPLSSFDTKLDSLGIKAGCSLSQFCALAAAMPPIPGDFMEITLLHHASVSLFAKEGACSVWKEGAGAVSNLSLKT